MLSLILLVFALVLFIVAAFVKPPEPWPPRLTMIGFACWVGSEILRLAPTVLPH